MGVLLLVRHGQASFTSDDYDRLSGAGHDQARVLGRALAARGFAPDVVVRGAMRRHRETADNVVVTAGWGCGVEEDAGWDEFDHVSTISGMPDFAFAPGESYEDRVQRADELISRWASGDHDADYHEDFPTFRDRVGGALQRTLGRTGPDGHGVVFTSGGPVAWVAASLLDGGVPLWGGLSGVVVNSSVTKVVVGKRRGPTLVTFNDHSHLEATPSLLTYR